ncbi:MAG: arsenate reductase ArsC [Bryobacterales bacterium]|nr:arsenate reductase ArsC [Bryobacterales bacterium]
MPQLDPAGESSNRPPRVLILCTANSARSQMAEGLLRHDFGDRFLVESAGSKPGVVRPEAIAALAEIGIDITHHRSKHVDQFAGQSFDWVITVCDHARDVCPVFPAATRMVHHAFPDPAAADGDEHARLDAFRAVRDQIRQWLRTGFATLQPSPPPA